MVRYLTERLPAMVAPRWILNQVQTIAVGDILDYLVQALGRPETVGVVDVGAEPVTFKEMMKVYADVRGLPRLILPVPVLPPRLAARDSGGVAATPSNSFRGRPWSSGGWRRCARPSFSDSGPR